MAVTMHESLMWTKGTLTNQKKDQVSIRTNLCVDTTPVMIPVLDRKMITTTIDHSVTKTGLLPASTVKTTVKIQDYILVRMD